MVELFSWLGVVDVTIEYNHKALNTAVEYPLHGSCLLRHFNSSPDLIFLYIHSIILLEARLRPEYGQSQV